MRAVIQRVQHAAVSIGGNIHSSIQGGILVLLGIEETDNQEDIQWISHKLINLRIFNDTGGIMNCSLADNHGELLLISQFTLLAATKKGNRPSYVRASKPETAIPVYENLIRQLEKDLGKKIQTGIFGANMQVSLLNDGPVTILLDSKQKDL